MDRRQVGWLVLLACAAMGAAPPQPNVDSLGDPLPPGAVARLGTNRVVAGASRLIFLPDGKRGVSADREVRIFEVKTGKEFRRMTLTTMPGDFALCAACSADGKFVAAVSRDG